MGKIKSYQRMAGAKKTVKKIAVEYALKKRDEAAVAAREPKEVQRALAEQALSEWQNRTPRRVTNLSDVLRRKY